jgi:excisionase family DNA binding protein
MKKPLSREAGMIDTQATGYVTVAEAAKRLHVSHPTVWRWIKAGKLPAYRVGPKAIRIKEGDLARLVQPIASPREELSPMQEATSNQTTTAISPLTEEERQRGLQALAELKALRQQMLKRRGGRPFPSSVEFIHKMRDERSLQLDHL